ncbi:Protein FAM184B [Dissostichus eleginoides]|uniref:Protein FAM184B n=1 Tax=Dissostichus eleginoides TaxID=100907 RepID=A0AAD9F546_DISEL|nr:Protein FAM184B [Dissostichus eleginoides]
MASGAGKAAQPLGPGSSVNGTAAEFPNIEQELYDYQMHSKMCKKIAQLTKVIYSLNMKNEEQEAALLTLSHAHHEELHRILVETCHEGEGSLLRTRLLELQDSLHEQQRAGVQADFECFRIQAEERGRETEAELRKKFEERLQAAEEELQEAKAHISDAQEESLRLGKELEKTMEQIQEMGAKCEALQKAADEERQREEEQRQRKDEDNKKERQTEKREDSERMKALLAEVKVLRDQSVRADEEKRRAVKEEREQWEQNALRERVKRAEAEVESHLERLAESKRNTVKLQERIQAEGVAKRAEEELGVAKERLLLQEDELQSRAVEELRSQVSRMQSRNRELELQSSGRNNDHARQIRQHAEALSSLRSEMVRAQTEELRRIQKHADDERDKLQKEVEKERETLDKNIEQVEAERANVQQKLEEEKKRLVEKAEEDRKRLKEQVRKAIEEVMRRHAAELHSVQEALSSERKTNQEVCAHLDEQRRNAEELRNELERDREELRTKLKDASNETCRLQSAIEHQDKKENGAPEAAASCGPQCSRQDEELHQTRSRLARTQEEGERQRDRQQREIASLRADKHRLEEKVLEQSRLNTERSLLDQSQRQTEDRIRAECEDRLRAEFRIEMNAAVAESEQRWQNKEQELQSQMSEQQSQLSELKSKAEQEKECPGENCHGNPEIDRLRKEVQDTKEINKKLRDLLQEPQTQTSGEERHSHAKALQALEREQNQNQVFERQLDESRCAMLELQRENTALKKQLKERSVQENPEAEKKKEEECVDLRINRDAQLEEEAQRLKEEVEKLRSLASEYSSAQTHLQARIVALENELREREERCRRREPRTDDVQLGRLQERLTERDQLIKRLVEERHQLQLHPPVAGDNSTLRLRDSKSRPGSVTPTMRRKRVESPPRTGIRYVSPSCHEPHAHLQAQSIRGPYLEQRGTEGLKQEWFTKYFSF